MMVPMTKKSVMSAIIRDAIRNSGRSLNQLSRETGITQGMLSRFMRDERTLTISTAERLCTVLGLELGPVKKPQPKTSPQKTTQPKRKP